MSEKPLHVQDVPLHVRVAEALGWKNCVEVPHIISIRFVGCAGSQTFWAGHSPEMRYISQDQPEPVPFYDTDWSATGPLIERFGISVYRPDEFCPDREFAWVAAWGGAHGWDDGSVCADEQEGAATPLEAVCRLILRLKDAGKLEG